METCADLYLDLLKRCLINSIYEDPPIHRKGGCSRYKQADRFAGKDQPSLAHTMIGFDRLSHLQFIINDLLARGVPGDFLEAGVWRGGATILMRGLLKVFGVEDRIVWVADSFRGFPPASALSDKSYTSPEFAAHDRESILTEMMQLQRGASLEAVRATFDRYHLLDDRVRFLPGWFRDTLPTAPIERLALLRIDCDLYDSTLEVLQSLYPRVSPGGYIVVDDYYTFAECRKAVHDYLPASFNGAIASIDTDAVFWRKV